MNQLISVYELMNLYLYYNSDQKLVLNTYPEVTKPKEDDFFCSLLAEYEVIPYTAYYSATQNVS